MAIAEDININLGGLDVHLQFTRASSYPDNDILVILGHFGTPTNYSDLTNSLSSYGNVTVADIPGFNNHSSLYKIGSRPTINELAEYLATIVNFRFRKKTVTLVGVGYGVAIATRMLQRQPTLTRKVSLLVSIDGMSHHDDFNSLGSVEKRNYATQLKFASRKMSSVLFKKTKLIDNLIEMVYDVKIKKNSKQKLMDWRIHDFRTYARTMADLLVLDNCSKSLNVKFIQFWSNSVNCFDIDVADQHLQIIYNDFSVIRSKQKFSKRIDPIKAMYSIKLPTTLNKMLLTVAKKSGH